MKFREVILTILSRMPDAIYISFYCLILCYHSIHCGPVLVCLSVTSHITAKMSQYRIMQTKLPKMDLFSKVKELGHQM